MRKECIMRKRLVIDEIRDLIKYSDSNGSIKYCFLDKKMLTCNNSCSCFLEIKTGVFSKCARTGMANIVR